MFIEYTQKSSQERIYKRSARITVLVLISAFGPYILPVFGLRLEHFVIYCLLGWLVVSTMLHPQQVIKIDRHIKWIAFIWIICISWIFLSTCINSISIQYRIYKVIASFENFFQPMAIILIISWLLSALTLQERYKLIRLICITTIIILCLNSIICIVSLFWDTSWFLKQFHGGSDSLRGSVYSRAVSNGRFSGIFNQPLESGVTYAMGLIFWVHMAVTTAKIKSIWWLFLFFLLCGGLLSVSKVFIFGGVPLAIGLWFWNFVNKLKIRKSTFLGWLTWGGISGFFVFLVFSIWSGLHYFLRLFDVAYYSSKGGFLSVFTAGRFGSGETGVIYKFTNVWENSPLYGFGAFIDTALDNGYLEFFYFGGGVGLLLYLLILILIFVQAFSNFSKNPQLSKLLFTIWIFIVGSGIGAPVLTINRGSIIIWISIVIIYSIINNKQIATKTGCWVKVSNFKFGKNPI